MSLTGRRKTQTRKDNFLVSHGPPFPLTKVVRPFHLEKNLRPLNHLSYSSFVFVQLLLISRYSLLLNLKIRFKGYFERIIFIRSEERNLCFMLSSKLIWLTVRRGKERNSVLFAAIRSLGGKEEKLSANVMHYVWVCVRYSSEATLENKTYLRIAISRG